MYKKIYFLIILYILPNLLYAQNTVIDSLKAELEKKLPGTTFIKTSIALGDQYQKVNNDVEAIKVLKIAYDVALKSNNKLQQGILLKEIGASYYNMEQNSEALDYFFKSLLISEEIKDTITILQNYNAIGIIYSNQKNHDMALKYFEKYANTAKSLKNNKQHLMRAYNNMGISFKNKSDLKSAEVYYRKALLYAKETNVKTGEMSCYYNIGVVYNERKDYKKSIEYTELGLKIAREMNNAFARGIAYINLSESYLKNNDLKMALVYSDSAIEITEKYGYKLQLKDTYEGRYKIYKALGDYKKAFEYVEKYLAMKDSLFNEETSNRVALAEKNYQAVKNEQEMEMLKQEKKVSDLKVKGLIIISGLAILAFAVFLWRFIEKKKSNKILIHQKNEISEQKKEITDSINYASRIQRAMLPNQKILEENFKDYFIFYKPKDIVSGDFYWFIKSEDKILLAVADCTGHGVPGALMSMIGADKLNHATLEKGLVLPSDILSDVNKRIRKALKQDYNTDTTKDGMDIALIQYDISENKLLFSGANRPLWLLRNKDILEYKPTKKSIAGFTDENQIYELTEITIKTNDSVYLFTDGFVDQFGGENNKKITTKKLKDLITQVSDLSLKNQKNEIEKYFEIWKRNTEQTDDVCIIGLKF